MKLIFAAIALSGCVNEAIYIAEDAKGAAPGDCPWGEVQCGNDDRQYTRVTTFTESESDPEPRQYEQGHPMNPMGDTPFGDEK